MITVEYYNSATIPELNEKHVAKKGDSTSYDVLIDVDGWRNDFRVGWYDYDNKKWLLYDDTIEIELEHMRWTHLPLLCFDKD